MNSLRNLLHALNGTLNTTVLLLRFQEGQIAFRFIDKDIELTLIK